MTYSHLNLNFVTCAPSFLFRCVHKRVGVSPLLVLLSLGVFGSEVVSTDVEGHSRFDEPLGADRTGSEPVHLHLQERVLLPAEVPTPTGEEVGPRDEDVRHNVFIEKGVGSVRWAGVPGYTCRDRTGHLRGACRRVSIESERTGVPVCCEADVSIILSLEPNDFTKTQRKKIFSYKTSTLLFNSPSTTSETFFSFSLAIRLYPNLME